MDVKKKKLSLFLALSFPPKIRQGQNKLYLILISFLVIFLVLIDRSWDHVQKSTPHFHKGQVCVVEEAENTKDSFFQFFQDKFSKKGLFACASEYMKKKFWGWIDSAPEH